MGAFKMNKFPELLSKFKINSLLLDNRMVMPPMATYFADQEGRVTDKITAYYRQRAAGGVGYITIEHTGVRADGRASKNMLMIHTDEHIEGLTKLVNAIHEEGGKVVVQISHAGRQTEEAVTEMPPVAPSAVPCPVYGGAPRALEADEIKEIVSAFALAAARVKKAGADGVEIHMAHGYLLNQFLSPLVNRRDDRYGGDFESRLSAPLEVLQGIRATVGPDYPIICRISADEYIEGGLRLPDSQKIAMALETNGADAIHVSACQLSSELPLIPHYYLDEGIFVHLAQGIKASVNIPVIAVGRIRTPELAEKTIASGKADLISMGRALIADPELPRKVLEGRRDMIVPCISCSRCVLSLGSIGSVRCTVNPNVSREHEWTTLKKATVPKKVWVIGGGPAGMKAAEIASLQGHDVTIFEKSGALGGRFLLAPMPPRKGVLGEFTDYLSRRIKDLNIPVALGKPFDPVLIEEGQPEAVILATGAEPLIPNQFMGQKIVSDEDVFSGKATAGNNVVILGGGGIGAELADLLSEQGKKVTIIEMREQLAMDLLPSIQSYLLERLKDKEVVVMTSTTVQRIEDECVIVESPEGRRELRGFDTMISSLGSKPVRDLESEIRQHGKELQIVGDSREPAQLLEALVEAVEAVLKLNR